LLTFGAADARPQFGAQHAVDLGHLLDQRPP
jgi:hypothetical protein